MKLQYLVMAGVLFCSQSAPNYASINDGLIAHYKLDDTSGPVIDSVDSYHGTNNGATRDGHAFQFDGVNDYVSTTFGLVNGAAGTYPNGMTISLWVNSTEMGNSGLVTARGAGFGASSQFLGLNAGHINPGTPNEVRGVPTMNLCLGNPSACYAVTTNTTINDNQWHHVLGSYDGSTLSVYVDGVGVSQPASGTAFSADVFKIGWDDYTTTESDRYLAGKIDDVRIWNRALSATEVASLQLRTDNDLAQEPRDNSLGLVLPDTTNLLVYTHGYGTPQDFFTDEDGYWRGLGKALNDKVGSPDWGVVPWDWTDNNTSPDPPPRGAFDILNNAADEGAQLGKLIAQKGYSHVHLIGHSAGANLISTAAQWVDTLTDSTIHTTFLDPLTPNAQFAEYYGAYSDWSDNYSVPDLISGYGLTYAELPNAHNVDVSSAVIPDKTYDRWSIENGHGWPVQFYVESIKNPQASWNGYGFGRSKEGGGWPINTTVYPPGNYWEVLDGGQSVEDFASVYRVDAAWQVANLPHITSDGVQVSGTSIDMPTFSPAWISMLIDTTGPVNFVTFDVDFLSEVGAEGLLAMYWDGKIVSTIDERYALPGNNSYTMWLSEIMEPGTYELAFRLDPYTEVQSRARIDNIQTGLAAVVPEPTSLVLLATCGLIFLHRNRNRS